VVDHQPAADLRRRMDVDPEALGHALLRQHSSSTNSGEVANVSRFKDRAVTSSSKRLETWDALQLW